MKNSKWIVKGVTLMQEPKYELYHHGVKGMKWGVRRYQNKDGSLTEAGKKRAAKRESDPDRNKRIAKKIAIAAGVSVAVAAAAVVYAKNPQAVNKVMSKVGSKTMQSIKHAGRNTMRAGKHFIRDAKIGVVEGFKEAAREAPKKAAKAVVTGITMNAAKRALDITLGKEEAARIFQANNNKKISSFWKVGADDRDDDD